MKVPTGMLAILVLAPPILVAGCATSGWTMFTENSSQESRVIRIVDGAVTADVLVGGATGEWVANLQGAPTGPISILDPTTCEVLDVETAVPHRHTVMVIDPDDQIYLGEDDPHGTPAPALLAPAFDDC